MCGLKVDSTYKQFPFDIKDVDVHLNKLLLEDFKGEHTGFVQVGPQKWFFPKKYAQEAQYIYNFQVRKDDIWVITFPRSGTTWTQELVWMISNNFNYSKAEKIPLARRFPFLEFNVFVHPIIKKQFLYENYHSLENQKFIEELTRPGWQILGEMKSPRFIKTHLPFSLLPSDLLTTGCKVIYVARNPKDVAVSYYYLNKLFRTQGYTGDFNKFWSYFENNLVAWSPYWSHVTEAWKIRKNPNFLFLFYEDMQKDLRDSIEMISTFLEKPPAYEQIIKLQEYLKIDNFKKNVSVNCQELRDVGILNSGENGFIRKGKTGCWVNEFTPELNKRADDWIEKNLQHTDLRFPNMYI